MLKIKTQHTQNYGTQKADTRNLMAYWKALEQQEEIILKKSQHGRMIQLRPKINMMETNKQNNFKKINEIRSAFFEKTNKIDKDLAY